MDIDDIVVVRIAELAEKGEKAQIGYRNGPMGPYPVVIRIDGTIEDYSSHGAGERRWRR